MVAFTLPSGTSSEVTARRGAGVRLCSPVIPEFRVGRRLARGGFAVRVAVVGVRVSGHPRGRTVLQPVDKQLALAGPVEVIHDRRLAVNPPGVSIPERLALFIGEDF